MRASQDLSRISTRFDDPNLVSHAGLVAPVSLAQALGLADLVDTHLTMSGPGSANRGLKTLSVVGAMLAGGDSIEDVDVLRAGGAARRGAGAVDDRDLAAPPRRR